MLKTPIQISVAPSPAPARPAAARNRDPAPSGFSALIDSAPRAERPTPKSSDARATRETTTAARGERRPRGQARDLDARGPDEMPPRPGSQAESGEAVETARAAPVVSPADESTQNPSPTDTSAAIEPTSSPTGSPPAITSIIPIAPVIVASVPNVAAATSSVQPASLIPASAPAIGGPAAIVALQAAPIQADALAAEANSTEVKSIESRPTETKVAALNNSEPIAETLPPGIAAAAATLPSDVAALKPIVRQGRAAPTAETTSAEAVPAADADITADPAPTAKVSPSDKIPTDPAKPLGTAEGDKIDEKPVAQTAKIIETKAPELASRPLHPAAAQTQSTSQAVEWSSPSISPLPATLLVHAAVPVSSAAHLTAIVAGDAPVPLNGLAVEIATRNQNGASSFSIRLDPADLGRIDVRLDVDNKGQVTSHLMVEKPETLAMLRQDAPQLQRALNEAGLKTSDTALQFSLGDQASAQQNADRGTDRQPQRLIVRDDDIIAAPAQLRGYGRLAGTRGGIDIRI